MVIRPRGNPQQLHLQSIHRKHQSMISTVMTMNKLNSTNLGGEMMVPNRRTMRFLMALTTKMKQDLKPDPKTLANFPLKGYRNYNQILLGLLSSVMENTDKAKRYQPQFLPHESFQITPMSQS